MAMSLMAGMGVSSVHADNIFLNKAKFGIFTYK
jgi:hypothetical protein